MKNLLILLSLSIFMLASCCGTPKNTDKTVATKSETCCSDTTKTKAGACCGDCDETKAKKECGADCKDCPNKKK